MISNLNDQCTSVAASPFNRLKLLILLALLLGGVFWIVSNWLQLGQFKQLLLLACYGILAAGYIAYKVRTIVRNYEQEVKK